MKKILKGIKNLGGDIYDKLYIQYRIRSFRKFYSDSYFCKEVVPVLTDEEKNQIDGFYLENYGKKVDYRYHNLFKFYSGKFDEKCIVDEIQVPKLFRFVNDVSFIDVMSNKNFLPLVAKAAGVKTPEVVVFSMRDLFYDKDYNIISREEAKNLLRGEDKLFIKPTVETGGGKNCQIIDKESCSEGLNDEEIEEIFHSFGTDFAVQRIVNTYEPVKRLHPSSVNTFRVVTYIYDGKIHNGLGVLRMGGGGSRVDNASKGGLYIGVRDDGTFNDYATSEYDGVGGIEKHQDSGIVFKGYKIDRYPQVIEAAKRIHALVPQIGVMDWDFTIDENGEPVLIESNCRNGGGIQMSQCNFGEGFFGENTAGILNWLRKAEKLRKSQRDKLKIHM